MRTRVQKWGNSLAVRIPKSFADDVGLEDGGAVDLVMEDGALILQPAREPALTLEHLVAGITEENRHAEIETGPAVGHEAW
jgi:antitoxin MazE